MAVPGTALMLSKTWAEQRKRKSNLALLGFLLPPLQLCCQTSQGFKQPDSFFLAHLSTIVRVVTTGNEKHQSLAHTHTKEEEEPGQACTACHIKQAVFPQWSESAEFQGQANQDIRGIHPYIKQQYFFNSGRKGHLTAFCLSEAHQGPSTCARRSPQSTIFPKGTTQQVS